MPSPARLFLPLALLLSGGCAVTPQAGEGSLQSAAEAVLAPFPSTYRPLPSSPTLIRGARLLVGDGTGLERGDVLMREGKIAAVGASLEAPPGTVVIDAAGRWVTPGIIDAHSHLGVYPNPSVQAHLDGNEATAPNTAEVWAEHSVWPQDPGFSAALAGGVTSMVILPGSANLFGGRSVTLKNVPARTVQDMKFPGAPYGLKMACGENPKRVYGSKNRSPASRMGNVAGYRSAWIEAARYVADWDKYEQRKESGEAKGGSAAGQRNDPPKRDLRLETLAGVLKGEIIVHNHCYRADEMAVMIDVAREFGYRIGTFHHAVESYKIADLLAEEGICSAMWADWWGFKLESLDGIRENVAMVDAAGACAVVHSDSEIGIQRLNQETAKAVAAGRRMGLDISPERAVTWITRNPALSAGILDQVGTLEVGKMADLVLWSDDPFSVYTLADQVYIDGALVFDRQDPARQPVGDFVLGHVSTEVRP
ncbi:MAG: amidohydrolase [Steroidobacteraceae bacterium]